MSWKCTYCETINPDDYCVCEVCDRHRISEGRKRYFFSRSKRETNMPQKPITFFSLKKVVGLLCLLFLLFVLAKNVMKQTDNSASFVQLVNDVEFFMVYVEGGSFFMGSISPQAEDDEAPIHKVTVDGFYICSIEVTQKLWYSIMGNNPSEFLGDDLPVENVSWNDVQLFLQRLNSLTGKRYRLPSEAEWEFAARGGIYNNGFLYSGSDNIDEVAWYGYERSDKKTHRVASKKPNELDLYDMSGNVYEWCQDWYGMYFNAEQSNPHGPNAGIYRVARGSSWNNVKGLCRVSNRGYYSPEKRQKSIGFRLALSKNFKTN